MSFSKLIESKSNHKNIPNDICKTLYKGACVKIKNSKKLFQVVGFNPESNVCWIREWPFDLEFKTTFSLEINQITLQTICSKSYSEK